MHRTSCILGKKPLARQTFPTNAFKHSLQLSGSICGPGVVTRADFSTPPQGQVAEFGGAQKLWHKTSRSNRYVDEGTQTNQEVDLTENDQNSSVRSVTSYAQHTQRIQ